MAFHPRLTHHLETLTEGLEDGADLGAIVSVLIDDLAELTPSFLGLSMTFAVDGVPVTVSTLDKKSARLVKGSLLLPLEASTGRRETTVIYFAATPGAFDQLAAAARHRYQLDGEVVVDQHLSPAACTPGITGLDELTIVSQAIGVLIDRGHLPVEAHAELRRLAADGGRTQAQAAEQILATIGDRFAAE